MNYCDCYDCTRKKNNRKFEVDVNDFEETFKHKKAAPKKRKPKREGCPGNNNKAHVYVKYKELAEYPAYPSVGIYSPYAYLVEHFRCAGCYKSKGGWRPRYEKYTKGKYGKM